MTDVPERRWPIGAIARALEADLKTTLSNCHPTEAKEAIRSVYLDYDARFQSRPDYRLWRCAMTPYFSHNKPYLNASPTPISTEWTNWAELALECATSKDHVVVWSAIALAPDLMGERGRYASKQRDHPIWPFIWALRKRLVRGLRPINAFRSSCGMAAAIFLVHERRLHFFAGEDIRLQELARFFDLLEEALRVVDPRWEPGHKLNTTEMQEERRGSTRLRAGHDAHEYTVMTDMLRILQPTISGSVGELNPFTEELLERAYHYALTAWLTARSRRIDEMQFQMRSMELDSWGESKKLWGEKKVKRAFLEEFSCQLKLSNAARDAGRYLDSAYHLYLLYRLIPTEFIEIPEVKDELRRRSATVRYLKEVGLEVDSRFASDKSSPEIQAMTKRSAEFMERTWKSMKTAAADGSRVAAGYPDPQVVSLQERRSDEGGFRLRVRHDQATRAEWHAVFREAVPFQYESPVVFLLNLLRSVADGQLPAQPATLSAAFSLALRYGYVRSAGKILSRSVRDGDFELTTSQLMDFVHSVRRCTQLDPFGLNNVRLAEWQDLIREACEYLIHREGSVWATASSRLWIHETVTNRTHVHHRALRFEDAALLYEKSYGTYDIAELREFYDFEVDFRRRALGVVNTTKVSRYCAGLGDSDLGAPVAISLMAFNDMISIVGIGSDKSRISAVDFEASAIAADIEEVLTSAEYWFKFESSGPIWPLSLRRLADAIRRTAKICDPGAQVLLISLDSNLAQLPWQHLIQQESDEPYLVAVVPSLSTLTVQGRTKRNSGITSILSDESSDEIEAIVRTVQATIQGIKDANASVCIIAGHGSPAEESALPSVNVGAGGSISSLEDWMGVLGKSVVILHCCHSGTSRPLFMQELGGVPGLGICLGTETFIAPVTEVYPTAASKLQTQLFETPEQEIGAAYLRAAIENPACSLYTLYGNPYERIVVPVADPGSAAVGSFANGQLAA